MDMKKLFNFILTHKNVTEDDIENLCKSYFSGKKDFVHPTEIIFYRLSWIDYIKNPNNLQEVTESMTYFYKFAYERWKEDL